MCRARSSERPLAATHSRWLMLLIAFVSAACSVEPHERSRPATAVTAIQDEPLLGLRSAIYAVSSIDSAKHWYAEVLREEPTFDEPYYVGFDVGGFELGLLPDSTGTSSARGSVTAYWGVRDIEAELTRLLSLGATVDSPITDVGGVRVATLIDPFGNVLGLIENPNFRPATR